MKKASFLLAASVAIQCLVSPAIAQQPGSAAYNSVYLPAHGVGDTRQQAPEQWGALVTGKGDVVGWAVDGETEDDAVEKATAVCRSIGGEGCRLEFTFSNECAVVAMSPTQYKWVKGTRSLRALRKSAMRNCGEGCTILQEGCALPRR